MSSFSTSYPHSMRTSDEKSHGWISHLDVPNDLLPCELGFTQALLHALVALNAVGFRVHKLDAGEHSSHSIEPMHTVIALTRLMDA